MASHSDPKWCCVSSLTKIVTFFAVPFWTIPTPPAVLHQLSFFDRCEDFVAPVGQAIAFCGLSCLGKARQPDRRQKPIVCPTLTTQLGCCPAALYYTPLNSSPPAKISWLPWRTHSCVPRRHSCRRLAYLTIGCGSPPLGHRQSQRPGP